MFLLYSFTSSLVCTEVSVGACLTWWAAADNYLLKNGITLSSTVATQTYQSVSHLYKDFFFFLSVAELVAVSIVALCCWSSQVGLSPICGMDSQPGLPNFPPGRCGVQAPKAFYFLRLVSTAWEQREERVEEGREKAKKKKAAPGL